MFDNDDQVLNTPDPESPRAKIARLEWTVAEHAKVINDKDKVIEDKDKVIEDKDKVIRQLRAKIECSEKADELKKVTEGFRLELDRGENLPKLLQRMTVTLVENQK